jgi:hypothetical protein
MMHQAYCMSCFALIAASDAVCPACGASAEKLSAQDYRDKLIRALRHPLADVRMRAVIALGLCAEPQAAGDLVQCALRHPTDLTEGLEIVRSLQRLPQGVFRTAALQTLLVRHPASSIREAALRALTDA